MGILSYVFFGYSILVFGIILYVYFKVKHEHCRIDQLYSIFNKFSNMFFLVDDKIEVQETNFYDKSGDVPSEKPALFGNVVHCRYGTDAGLCGTSEHCPACPVRALIRRSFDNGNDFKDVKVPMELYDKEGNVNRVDLNLRGQHVTVNGKDKIVIKAAAENDVDE